jgi:hypothetical protein
LTFVKKNFAAEGGVLAHPFRPGTAAEGGALANRPARAHFAIL